MGDVSTRRGPALPTYGAPRAISAHPTTGARSEPLGGRLVAVNRYYWPDESATAQLLTDLAEHLATTGREVVVVTSRQTYDDAAAGLPSRELHAGVRIVRIRTSRFGRRGLPGRAVDYLTFHLGACAALLREVRAGDTILAETDPPLISVVAWLVARLKGAVLVNWCQDLFPEIAAALGLRWAGGPVGRALAGLRDASLRGARVNVVLCEPMAANLRDRGVPAERIAVIHNWADGELIRPIPAADNPLRRAWDLEGRRVIGYCGNLGRAHDQPAVQAFVTAMAAAAPDLAFLFVGGGLSALEAWAREQGLDNVLTRPFQPRERLAMCLSLPDAHIVSLDPACEGLLMPSKLYGILAAGRPVIALGDPDGAVARLIRRLDAGFVWRPGREAEVLLLLERARDSGLGRRLRKGFDFELDRRHALDRWAARLGGAQPATVAATRAKERAA